MDETAIRVAQQLLPGFLTLWVFHGLTAHPRLAPFERVIDALVFTVIVNAAVAIVRQTSFLAGRWFVLGAWTPDVALGWSLLLAAVLGLTVAYFANNDGLYGLLRAAGVTTRTSFPSEWYSAFSRERRWVTLHLAGGRRLYGWPEEWPDDPDRGHFLIDQPEWLLKDGTRAPLYTVHKSLVPVQQVEMVEFLLAPEEVAANPHDVERAEQLLVALRNEEKADDGSKGTPAGTKSS